MDILSEFKRILDALLHSVSVTSILLLRLRMKRLLLPDCLDEWIPEAAMFFCSEKKLDRRHCCLLCKHLQSQVGIFSLALAPALGLADHGGDWSLEGGRAPHHWLGELAKDKVEKSGGGRRQASKGEKAGAGRCWDRSGLLLWPVSTRVARFSCVLSLLLHGRPAFSSFSTLLCPTPRPDAVSSSWCLDLLWPGQPPFDPASARLAGLDAWWFIMCLVGYIRKNEMRRPRFL